MALQPVIIKTVGRLNKTNPIIVNALMDSINQERRIPMVYQLSHTEPFELKSNEIVGEIYNIRKDKCGNVIGDVELYPTTHFAYHYQNTIDNIVVSNNPNNGEPNIDAFIIYDRRTKEATETRKRISNDLQKAGNIPFMSSPGGPGMLKEISDTLIKEYEKLVSLQQEVNSNKGGLDNGNI